MADASILDVVELSPDERKALGRVLKHVAQSADAIDQALDALDHLADSGNLAALDGVFEQFDDNFNAITRPELMGMVANAMMLMGLMSQVRYEPFFNLAMRTPEAINDQWPGFRTRTKPMGLLELLRLMRSPEMAGALEMMAAVAKSEREGKTTRQPSRER